MGCGSDVEDALGCELVDGGAHGLDVANELIALPEFQTLQTRGLSEHVDERHEVVDQSLILSPMHGQITLHASQRSLQMFRLRPAHSLDPDVVPRSEVVLADCEQTERVDEVVIDETLRNRSATRGAPARLSATDRRAQQTSSAIDVADDLGAEVLDARPIRVADRKPVVDGGNHLAEHPDGRSPRRPGTNESDR